MIKVIVKTIFALNGNVKKSQLAAGFAWGFLLGLIPAGNFFWIILFLVSFFFKNNHATKLCCMFVIKLFGPLLLPLVDIVGWEFLHIESLQPLFINLYNMPFVPFTKFNNTLVTGGLVSGAVLWLPVFFLFFLLVDVYRNIIAPKIRNLRIIKVIAKFPLLSLIDKAIADSK